MSNIGFIRTQKECKEILTSNELKENGITIKPVNDNLSTIIAHIRGPPDSPYEGGDYCLDIRIPSEYPFQPPKVTFSTKIWHPNISSQTGALCLDILKEQWAASMTLRTVLLSVQSLLAAPEPKDPQDAVVAKQCMAEKELFQRTAKLWCQYYAKGPGEKESEMMKKVAKIMDMGVSKEKAIFALSCNNWCVSEATENIFD